MKRKCVTVEVFSVLCGMVGVKLAPYSSDANTCTCPDKVMRMSVAFFNKMAADHGMTLADFPLGTPVRVSEPA